MKRPSHAGEPEKTKRTSHDDMCHDEAHAAAGADADEARNHELWFRMYLPMRVVPERSKLMQARSDGYVGRKK